jgi:VWFA-related protein
MLLSGGQDAPPVFRSNTSLVEVYATVVDGRGRHVDDLDRSAFTILDGGSARPIVSFENSATTISCAIVLDTTASMRPVLQRVRQEINHLVDHFRDGDYVAAYKFAEGLELLHPFTIDKMAIKQALTRTRAEGGTALFDAIAKVALEVSPRGGKKALVVFTDGADNASMLNAASAAETAKKVGVPVYAAAQGDALHQPALLNQLRNVARVTGGKVYTVTTLNDAAKIFEDISEELRHTYLLTFAPPPDAVGWRPIAVRVAGGRGHQVRAREAYLIR